jgi:zinc protease
VKFPKPKYTITSSWGCNPDSISKLSQIVLGEMAKIKKNGPSVEDLNKVKETLIRERETRLKENNFWISSFQNLYLNDDRLMTLDEYKTFVNSFTEKDIKKVAGKYLDTENYVKVALTPVPKVETNNPK